MPQASVRVLGKLDTPALQTSLDAVIHRHESLRTRILTTDGTPWQHVDGATRCDLDIADLGGLSPTNAEKEACLLAQNFFSEHVDISTGPLFSAKLIRLTSDEHLLILAIDHIISDAISCNILSRELWTLYKETTQGLATSLPPLAIQYADYAVWQQRTFDAWLRKHETYWRRRLTGAPRLQLPFDSTPAREEPQSDNHLPFETSRWASLQFPLGKPLSDGLRQMATRERVLLPLLVLAACTAVISHWCHQDDVVLAFVSHGRHSRPELKSMIGFLASRLHLRVEVSYGCSFLDLLKQVKLEFANAYQHQDFDRVPHLIPECDAQVQFNWIPSNGSQQRPRTAIEPVHPLRTQPFIVQLNGHVNISRLPILFLESDQGIVMTVWYRADLFDSRNISQLGDGMRFLANGIIGSPRAALGSMLRT